MQAYGCHMQRQALAGMLWYLLTGALEANFAFASDKISVLVLQLIGSVLSVFLSASCVAACREHVRPDPECLVSLA